MSKNPIGFVEGPSPTLRALGLYLMAKSPSLRRDDKQVMVNAAHGVYSDLWPGWTLGKDT